MMRLPFFGDAKLDVFRIQFSDVGAFVRAIPVQDAPSEFPDGIQFAHCAMYRTRFNKDYVVVVGDLLHQLEQTD